MVLPSKPYVCEAEMDIDNHTNLQLKRLLGEEPCFLPAIVCSVAYKFPVPFSKPCFPVLDVL